ncbi:polycomb protein SUZ12-like [Tubulanus polymorphus]|uniref:polycomb protein SUZ12-like n=1 Tax=Tubulanus polymorphus TaxID=672921 RepID=UPI003DA623DC
MRPKKKPKELIQIPKPIAEDAINDHEAFLQAFEKPTQIYRYLRMRNLISPIFLHRNLTFMRKRMSRNNKNRENLSVDDVLKNVTDKDSELESSIKSKVLTLDFGGFFLKDELYTADNVEIEAFILKLSHKNRKGSSPPFTKTSLGKVEVSYNPETLTYGSTVIMVNNENFSQTNGNTGRSYVLQLWVKPVNRKLMNGYSDHKNSEDTGPLKRIKVHKKELECTFSTELVIYDKHKKCQLKNGEYEVAVYPMLGGLPTSPPSPVKSVATWESLKDVNVAGPFEVFNTSPTIKFKLSWSGDIDGSDTDDNNTENSNSSLNSAAKAFRDKIDRSIQNSESPRSPRTRVFYQFIYNKSTRQQTEARSDYHCPWCMLNCIEMYGLLKHLRLSHSRFNFIYSPHPQGARIDVSLNESYDGSYDGNPHDALSNIGCAFCRVGPVRRTPVTCLLVYRPKRGPASLTEFMEVDEPDNLRNRSLRDGHNRLYYHTESNQPVHPSEIIVDSEGENDPAWLRQKTIALIDDFTDVNEGEKEIMKMWNLHTMHENYIGDCQLAIACSTFIERFGRTVLEKNLTKNLMLHMVSLYDFSLIKPDVVYRTMNMLQALREKLEDEGALLIKTELTRVADVAGEMEVKLT